MNAPNNKYKHLFFDLDRTLWDFETNSVMALEEIFYKRNIGVLYQVDFHDFHEFYKSYNAHLWDLYKHGVIDKEHLRVERFRGSLNHFDIDNEDLAHKIADDYVVVSPRKTQLFPHTIEVLEYLHQRYPMHIITNGFTEVQFVKLTNCGLDGFFKEVITSEMVGVQKPNKAVFEFAMQKAGALAEESIMIGDDQVSDVQGAREAGMDQAFVNYYKEDLIFEPTFHIFQLRELKNLL
jgi:putative hydrolase of the HAD superfamily